MAKRPVGTADILDGQASLDSVWIDQSQRTCAESAVGGQVVQFLAPRVFPIPSPAVINRISDGFPPVGALVSPSESDSDDQVRQE
jgi:hypothetical protein